GAAAGSGALDLARAITRRAERRCVTQERAGGLPNPDVRRWLNRLSLVLFGLGRYEGSQAGRRAQPAKGSEPGRSSYASTQDTMDPLAAVGIVLGALLVLFLALSYQVYRRAFVPARPMWLDDFSFTPFEFQADYEEVELVTADGINFGAWHFRQPGSPQTVIVSGGHKGQRQGALGIA